MLALSAALRSVLDLRVLGRLHLFHSSSVLLVLRLETGGVLAGEKPGAHKDERKRLITRLTQYRGCLGEVLECVGLR